MSDEGKTKLGSPEYRAKVSAAQKVTWANPEHRARQMAARAASTLYSGKGSIRAERIRAKARDRWSNPEFLIGHKTLKVAVIDGVQYPSIADAVRQTGLSRYIVTKRVRSAALKTGNQ